MNYPAEKHYRSHGMQYDAANVTCLLEFPNYDMAAWYICARKCLDLLPCQLVALQVMFLETSPGLTL